MKLTKVLVGLLAVSLCGAAVAVKKTRSVGVDTRPQEKMTAAELYSIFLKEVRKTTVDKTVVTDLFNAIMTKTEGRGLLANSMKSDLREYKTGLDYSVLESAWNKAFRSGKELLVSKKTETIIKKEEIKKEEGKAGAWAWGAEPDWKDSAAVGKWSDKTTNGPKSKDLIPQLEYGIKMMDATDKSLYKTYIEQAKDDIEECKKA